MGRYRLDVPRAGVVRLQVLDDPIAGSILHLLYISSLLLVYLKYTIKYIPSILSTQSVPFTDD